MSTHTHNWLCMSILTGVISRYIYRLVLFLHHACIYCPVTQQLYPSTALLHMCTVYVHVVAHLLFPSVLCMVVSE